MQRKSQWIVLLAAFALFVTTSRASGWVGVYALIDKVVFEPTAEKPERVQIWGAFTLGAVRRVVDGFHENVYSAPQRGYLYFTGASTGSRIPVEWADLKTTAGTGQVIGFGIGRALDNYRIRVRNADEEPSSPDNYPIAGGLYRTGAAPTDYPPIKSLRDLSR